MPAAEYRRRKPAIARPGGRSQRWCGRVAWPCDGHDGRDGPARNQARGREKTARRVEAWREEYERCVRVPTAESTGPPTAGDEFAPLPGTDLFLEEWHRVAWDDYLEHERYLREAEYGVNNFD